MSSVSLHFAPEFAIESIEEGRTYPKKAVISYLSGQSIANCFKDHESGSKELTSCEELDILIEFYGLIPLGPDKQIRFLGRNVIESEIRRSMDDRVNPVRRRITRDQIRALKKAAKNESVGEAESGGS